MESETESYWSNWLAVGAYRQHTVGKNYNGRRANSHRQLMQQ